MVQSGHGEWSGIIRVRDIVSQCHSRFWQMWRWSQADGLTTPHSRKMEHSGRGDTTLVETAERIKPRWLKHRCRWQKTCSACGQDFWIIQPKRMILPIWKNSVMIMWIIRSLKKQTAHSMHVEWVSATKVWYCRNIMKCRSLTQSAHQSFFCWTGMKKCWTGNKENTLSERRARAKRLFLQEKMKLYWKR